MTELSKVFLAITQDGRQFDSIEAISAVAAYADISLIYEGEPNIMMQGECVDIRGFRVEHVHIPVRLHRDMVYWSVRLACCSEPESSNGKWIQEQFVNAHDAMMRHLG